MKRKQASLNIERTADISQCKQYRYQLTRIWNRNLPTLLFVMLNPSTADGQKDDPTIRRCIDFAQILGFGSIRVVNLFAYRATRPDVMFAAHREQGVDIVGPENDQYIRRAVLAAGKVVLAWGAHGHALGRDAEVSKLIPNAYCLEVTGHGHPKHPLYIKATTPLKITQYNEEKRQWVIPAEEHKLPLPCSLTGTPAGMFVEVAEM